MPTRPDLRELASNVQQAFADMDRDALLDILTFVIKEYVVEGPPPMLIHQAETLADLKTANFAQLVTAMQTRFDFPELAMFVVDGDNVSVRVNGVVQPMIAPRTPPGGMQMVDTRQPASAPPQPGVRVVETPLQQRPQPTQAAPSAPPPTRGLSVRGRPSDGETPAAPPPAQGAQPAPAAPAAPQAAPQPSDKPEGTGDDASARFSLLELD